MGRTLVVNPVTRIEGHAKVDIEIDDNDQVVAARLHVLEFRGFEKFVEGMQVELMPTLTTRICGTCPHAHHLVAAKCVNSVFGALPPRAAVLQRQLLECREHHSLARNPLLCPGCTRLADGNWCTQRGPQYHRALARPARPRKKGASPALIGAEKSPKSLADAEPIPSRPSLAV